MKTFATLTKTQFGLYVECVNHQGEACYNLPFLYTFDGSLDEEKLNSDAVYAYRTERAGRPSASYRRQRDICADSGERGRH